MRIILDENVPWPVAEWLSGHEVTNVQRQGWSGIKNGELMMLVSGQFELFVTADKNLRYQQNIRSYPFAILELPSNRLPLLIGLKQILLSKLRDIQSGEYYLL